MGGLASGYCAENVFFSFSVHIVLLGFQNLECVRLGVLFFISLGKMVTF